MSRAAGLKVSPLMCAEAVPWRCHPSLVADALLVRRHSVEDIVGRFASSDTPADAVRAGARHADQLPGHASVNQMEEISWLR